MPSYYNPYNFYPASYMQTAYPSWNPGLTPTAVQMQQSSQPGPKMMEWVEGEVGAKAFQMPNGWPANSPIPLWDSTDTVIWLKSWGPMGIPNPMQKLRYEMPENQNPALLNGQSGAPESPDMSQYVTRKDFDILREEIRQMNSRNNQNGSNNTQNGNRGGGK